MASKKFAPAVVPASSTGMEEVAHSNGQLPPVPPLAEPPRPKVTSIKDALRGSAGLPPLKVGNPRLSMADLAISQEHMEEYVAEDEGSAEVEASKPAKGIYFATLPEPGSSPVNRAFYYILELPGQDPYVVLEKIALLKKEEDVLRPMLLVRYVTMAGDEGIWPIKLDKPGIKTNGYNKSSLFILNIAEANWVRMSTGRGYYKHQISKKTFADTPPRFSKRSFPEMLDRAYPADRLVCSLDHPVWDELDNGSVK